MTARKPREGAPSPRDETGDEPALGQVPPVASGIPASTPELQFASASAIGNRAARGGAVLVARNGLLQVLQVVGSIILAKAISPNDYGAFAIAATLVGMARAVGDLGLSQSLVVRSGFAERDLRTSSAIVLTSAMAVGCVVAVIGVIVNAGLLSGAGPPGLVAAYAGTLVIDALRLGPIVRLTRALRFKEMATAMTAEVAVMYITQIVLLLCGLGLWALVIAQYARAITGVLVYRRLGGPIARPWGGGRPRQLVLDALPYQGPLVASGLVGAVLPLVVAAGLGARGLGLWAWSTILAVPLAAALVTIQSVLVPSLARLHGQYEEHFAAAADRLARLVAIAAGAGAGAMVGLAPDIVQQIFGPRWNDAAGAVQVTLLGLVPLAMSQLLSATMQARGLAVARFRCALIASVVTLVVVYPLTLAAGVTGAALASAVVGPTVDMLLLARVTAIPLRRAALNGGLALALVGSLSFLLGHAVSSAPGLATGCLATGLFAVALMWAIDRSVLRYSWLLLRSDGSPR